jgi:hypothetical protein
MDLRGNLFYLWVFLFQIVSQICVKIIKKMIKTRNQSTETKKFTKIYISYVKRQKEPKIRMEATTKFAGSTQNAKKIIGTPNQLIRMMIFP